MLVQILEEDVLLTLRSPFSSAIPFSLLWRFLSTAVDGTLLPRLRLVLFRLGLGGIGLELLYIRFGSFGEHLEINSKIMPMPFGCDVITTEALSTAGVT